MGAELKGVLVNFIKYTEQAWLVLTVFGSETLYKVNLAVCIGVLTLCLQS